MATSVPVAMAMPTSAAASAGASLMPSPTMATTLPSRAGATTSALSPGSTSARTCVDAELPRRPRRPLPAVVAGEHHGLDAQRVQRATASRARRLDACRRRPAGPAARRRRDFAPATRRSGPRARSSPRVAASARGRRRARASARRCRGSAPGPSTVPARRARQAPRAVGRRGADTARARPGARTALRQRMLAARLQRRGQAQQLARRSLRAPARTATSAGLPSVSVPVLSKATP